MKLQSFQSHLEPADALPKAATLSIPTSPLKSTHSLPHYEGPIKAPTAKGLHWRATSSGTQAGRFHQAIRNLFTLRQLSEDKANDLGIKPHSLNPIAK